MTVQFDELFELTVDIDESSREYSKLIQAYPSGRIPKIISIEEIYEGVEKGEFQNPQLPEVKGYNSYIKKGDIKKIDGIYKPKAMIFLADELNELMTSDDYKSVDTVKGALGSIARLGRAAGVHLALAAQRASGGTISSDLKNNIQMSCLLGGFDSGASTLMFEKDISNLAKPEIKGRGFLQSGNEIIETQTYFTEPENDWVFDESQRLTYDNPVYIEQCKRKGKEMDDSGFVEQFRVKEEKEDLPDDFDEDDEDIFDDDDEFTDFPDEPSSVIPFKTAPTPPPEPSKPGLESLMDNITSEPSSSTPVIPKTPPVQSPLIQPGQAPPAIKPPAPVQQKIISRPATPAAPSGNLKFKLKNK